MSESTFDRSGWEQRWQQVMTTHADVLSSKAPSAYVTDELAELFAPTGHGADAQAADVPDTRGETAAQGRVLDAGAGHGAEALWLARRGWRVTAVDFSRTALDFGRAAAEAAGQDVAARIDWVEGDLGSWAPDPRVYDVVLCLYVHCAGDMGEMIERLAQGVKPGGSLVMVGHQARDPETGALTRAAGQYQVSLEEASAALDAAEWELLTLERRRRDDGLGGVDDVVRAVRRG